jgi:serine kinase of HPr protein (carbohydrate metabolism regulator)
MVLTHATCIAFDGLGVLLRGASGSGKSDLALRAIEAGARLVADDQVMLAAVGGAVMASAPAALKGLIEIRGLGLMRVEALDRAPVALVVDLARPAAIERMPERRSCDLAGVGVPCVMLAPFEASAVAKLRFALAAAAEPARLP